MYTSPAYRAAAPQHAGSATAGYSQDIRPLITRHRLRKQRKRKAATLLTGASIAFGVAALRPPSASAQSAAGSALTITHTAQHPVHEPVAVQHHPAPDRPSEGLLSKRDWIAVQPP